jgi:hypothetical protein
MEMRGRKCFLRSKVERENMWISDSRDYLVKIYNMIEIILTYEFTRPFSP